MNQVTLTIPISKTLKQKAEIVARKQGYLSLSETIKKFVSMFARHELTLEPEEEVVLSPRAIKRYNKAIKDIEAGKIKGKTFDSSASIDEIMEYLNS